MLGIDVKLVRALVKRDLRMYFTNPTGYVFITLFIFLSAAAAFWVDRFFLDNLATLDQLNSVFPLLLVFFVPALTMGVWAEERKQGTDELLLTLPASDLEITLGKYLASLAVYLVSLVLSLSHVLVLVWLGSPDPGLLLGNYLGYAFAGAAFIAAGMLASLLTANATIAFILGALFSALLAFFGASVAILSEPLSRLLSPIGVTEHFEEFARGVVSLEACVYFVSWAGFLLYLNVLLLGRRHWPREASGRSMRFHHTLRAIAIGVGLLSVNAMLGRLSVRLDVTAERLHTLSPETKRLVKELDPERPVFLQAFVSPEVPGAYVQTRQDLLSVLRDIAAVAGPRVQLRIEDTEPYSEAAREAREKFGIVARQVPNLRAARVGFNDVFLGVAVTCGPNEQVIPFLDRGLPVEYEITRSIRVVAKTERKKIGVVSGEVSLFGGLDFQTMRNNPAWSVVEELKKQYDVVQIRPTGPITDTLDGLLVTLPSSLPQEELDHVRAAIEGGLPALLLDDPLPLVDVALAPSERPGANRNPFMQQGQPPPQPKGDVEAFLSALGIAWNKARVVWDTYNPHPELAHLPPEVVFVGEGSESSEAFNRAARPSAGLEELVLLYPGMLDKAPDSKLEFVPLARSGRLSGSFDYSQMVQRSFLGVQLARGLRHVPEGSNYVLAGWSRAPAAPAPDAGEEEAGAKPAQGVNVIFVADLDFISEQFFQIRSAAPGNLRFDNVSFFLDCIDVLVGDESFIDLRNRRVAHRTLERVEEQTRRFVERRAEEDKQAEAEAELALSEAQKRLTEKVQEVQQRGDLDSQTKAIMARNLEQAENRRFEVVKAKIETDKEAKVQRSSENMEAQIRRIQSGIRTSAVLLPPIPVFVLGVVIFLRRRRREREGAAAARRLRSAS